MKLSRLFFLLLALVVFAGCGGGGDDDEDNDSGTSASLCRIIGGNTCEYGGSPVARLDLQVEGGVARCTGTLVAPDKVLTAAHCVVSGISAANARVGGEDIAVIGAAFHADYAGNASYDVALLTLERSSGVTPVPLLASVPVNAGDELRIYGFGVKEDGDVSDDLRTAVIHASSANSLEISSAYNGADSCPGDSGGPITKTVNGIEYVVGVVSLGLTSDPDANPLLCGEGWVGFYASVQDASVHGALTSNSPAITVD
jgi:V8-like Glu-specific endopeptidase